MDIEKIKQEFEKEFGIVEFLHGVPVDLPIQYKDNLLDFLGQKLQEAYEAGYEQAYQDRGPATCHSQKKN